MTEKHLCTATANDLCDSKDRHEYVDTFEFGHFAVSQYDKVQHDSACQTESAIRVNADHLVVLRQNSDNCTRSILTNCGEVNYAAISLKPIKCSFLLQEPSPMEVTLLVLVLMSNNRSGREIQHQCPVQYLVTLSMGFTYFIPT